MLDSVDSFGHDLPWAACGTREVVPCCWQWGGPIPLASDSGLVPHNAASLSVMPRTPPPAPRRSLTAAEAQALLEAAKGERWEALIVLGLTAGLRPGELTGLLWEDLELDAVTTT